MLHAVLLAVLICSGVTLSSSQSCGSSQCSKAYATSCNDDMSCHIYDDCKTSHTRCNKKTGPAPNLKVNCYDTCIKGNPFNPSIPSQCCANSILLSETIATSRGSNYLIARLYSPNEPGVDAYRQSTFCKYNVQCPNNNYELHYFMVDFDVEPPSGNGQCLDFLRYHFTATGADVSADACGEKKDLTSLLKSGVHGSGLTLDFRSNRVHTGGSVFLSLSCILPQANRVARDENSCTPSVTQQNRSVSNPYNSPLPEDYLDEVFPNEDLPYDLQHVTVSRKGVVKYKDNTVIVKENGRTVRRFRNISDFQVYNEIEGYLSYKRSSNPRSRNFPGYGYLQVGSGFAQYIQTISEPTYLANDDEEDIVNMMYGELFNRRVFEDERFYFRPPEEEVEDDETVDCDIEDLAELNSRSCTPLVRATANFFLERSAAVGFCKKRK